MGQELCFAVPCIVAWAGGSGAAVFAGTTGANQGVLCQGPLKDQACSGLYLSAGRSHRGEINPSDGINCCGACWWLGTAQWWWLHWTQLWDRKAPRVGAGLSCCILLPACTQPHVLGGVQAAAGP